MLISSVEMLLDWRNFSSFVFANDRMVDPAYLYRHANRWRKDDPPVVLWDPLPDVAWFNGKQSNKHIKNCTSSEAKHHAILEPFRTEHWAWVEGGDPPYSSNIIDVYVTVALYLIFAWASSAWLFLICTTVQWLKWDLYTRLFHMLESCLCVVQWSSSA